MRLRVLSMLGLLAGCGDVEVDDEPATLPTAASVFVDASESTGLDFVHVNGMTGRHYFSEMMGGGAALVDIDNDGDLDVYLVQGGALEDGEREMTDRLFRNDLADGVLRFTDVTGQSGALSDGYGMGVTSGDFDNDGWVDLYVTNFGPNRLLRNRGDGTLEDVTDTSGTDDGRWSVAATFFDFDRDGWLDLYVGNYVGYTIAAHQPCRFPSGAETYCSPSAYPPEPDRLFRNRGDHTFEDVTAQAGLRDDFGAGLGSVAADVNGDRWLDLYVANDGMPNQLWINQQDGSFVNEALFAGVAVNEDGQPEASMGVDALDFDADGDIDLVMTHLDQESNTVYANDGTGHFQDVSFPSGLGLPSLAFTGFGAGWLDYDNDGWLDFFVANGAVVDLEPLIRAGDPFPLHQINQLFRNTGTGRFEEVTATAGDGFALSEVSRGAAFGDVDNDGDTDILVVNNHGRARLLINGVGQSRPWVGVRAVDAGRDALGAEVVVSRSQGPPLARRVGTDGSYASASDPRVLVGIGETAALTKVLVRWPDGTDEAWTRAALSLNAYTTLRRGEGAHAENR